jgi:hypothetical protein
VVKYEDDDEAPKIDEHSYWIAFGLGDIATTNLK